MSADMLCHACNMHSSEPCEDAKRRTQLHRLKVGNMFRPPYGMTTLQNSIVCVITILLQQAVLCSFDPACSSVCMPAATDAPDNCCQHTTHEEGLTHVIWQWLAGVKAHKALMLRLVDNCVEAAPKAGQYQVGLAGGKCKTVQY